MINEKVIPGLGLTAKEFNDIESYQKSRNSAVLTIMFTDIQGFTSLTEERGESYVHMLHSEHDKIIVDCVERDGAGIVIKYIGDSVMAVFSEPTAAVDRALQIQKRLYEFNHEHPDLVDLYVRIGLHMGQTVLENKMHVDLFGRHVNKASRIESLADGGHIFISYPVFDSIKSWLIEAKYAVYTYHGQYLLKGIDKPEDIYEVYNISITKPKAPKKGKKRAINGKLLIVCTTAVCLLLLILLLGPRLLLTNGTKTSLAAPVIQSGQTASAPVLLEKEQAEPLLPGPEDVKTTNKGPDMIVEESEVYFISLNALEPILDLETPLVLAKVEGTDNTKKSLIPIAHGRHVIHFVVSDIVHYFYEFEVGPGKNFLPAKFIRSELPSVQVNLFLRDDEKQQMRKSSQEYFYYTRGNLEKKTLTGQIEVSVKGTQVSSETAQFTIEYSLVIDNKEAARNVMTVESPMNSNESTYSEPLMLIEDDYHAYYIRYFYNDDSIQINLDAAFKDFSKR